jgi:hypothetical protein
MVVEIQLSDLSLGGAVHSPKPVPIVNKLVVVAVAKMHLFDLQLLE